MNTTAMDETPVRARTTTEIPVMKGLYWAVRRELWENRYLYLAPLAVAALILVGFTIGLVRFHNLADELRATSALDAMRQHEVIEEPYTFAALLLMFVTLVCGIFYCLDALYGERRDRSVLFWKSLPVSDLTTVLAKASIPLVVLPLLTFAVTVATQVGMLLLASGRLMGTGLSVWAHLSFGRMSWILFYHLVVGHGLSWAPLWGWLLLCSAWSKRAPLLWATLPLLAVGLVEKIAFNSAHFGHLLAYRIAGGPASMPAHNSTMTIADLTPALGQFLTSPGFWFGLALTAGFLAAAVRLRRNQGPI